MLQRFIDFAEGLPPRTMLVVNLTYTVIAIVINSLIAYALWRTFAALYPVATGWVVFGLVWALLTGAATILTNITKLVFRAPTSIKQYREEIARGVRLPTMKYRTAR